MVKIRYNKLFELSTCIQLPNQTLESKIKKKLKSNDARIRGVHMCKKGTFTPVFYHTQKLIWAGLQTRQWSI